LAAAHDDKTRRGEPARRDEVEHRPVLALEPIGRRRPPDQIAGRPKRAARGGPEFDPFLTEQDKNTLGRRGKGSKFKLQAARHEALPLDSSQSGSRFCGRNQASADGANLSANARAETGIGRVFAPTCAADRVEARGRKAAVGLRAAPPQAPSSEARAGGARKGLLRARLWPPRHTI